MTDKITFVSLGPGDAELISLKGLKALQAAHCIFSVQTALKKSRSGDILQELGINGSKIIFYALPMSKDRDAAIEAYDRVACRAVEMAKEGKKVVITAEGDAGFYSSSQYINERVRELGAESVRISGIPAFIECSAVAGMHLVSGDNSLEVVPLVRTGVEILQKLKENKTVVLMKLPQSQKAIFEFLSNFSDGYEVHYFENVGTHDREFYSNSVAEISAIENFPYFSIMIIK